MISFLERIWYGVLNGLQRLGNLVVPVFSQAQVYGGLSRGVRWFLHILVVAVILWGLHWLNGYFNIHRLIPTRFPVLADNWLPILFLLMYALLWVGWWLWKLLSAEEEMSDFPDIDEAWEEAMQALGSAGIHLTDVPVFLMLGRPLNTDLALFQGSGLQLPVKGVPERADAPIRVFANRDAAYITCLGASLLARQAEILAAAPESAGALAQIGALVAVGAGADEGIDRTLRPKGGPEQEIVSIIQRATKEGRGLTNLTEAERNKIKLLELQTKGNRAPAERKPRPFLLKDTDQVDLLSARLRHLCRLIARDRRPYCPVNGLLMLVPFAATETEEDATQTGDIARRELDEARGVLQVHCPTFALVCDLETAPGFRNFIDRFSDKERQQRMGQRFPLVPEVRGDAYPAMIEGGVQYLCSSVFPSWVFRFFHLESGDEEDWRRVTRGNAELYQLMGLIRERHKRLSRLLSRALAAERDGPPLFGGCYLAGTGTDKEHEQAFFPGVVRRLVNEQNFVSWTQQALHQEAEYNRWSRIGWTIMGGILLAIVVGLLMQNFLGGGRGR